jgi:hypothetical protein
MSNLLIFNPVILGLALSQFAGRAQTPAFVQQNYSAPQSVQSSLAVAYPAAQAAGNANIIVIGWNDTFASIASVTDSAGNGYQLAVPLFQTNGMSQAIYYALGIRSGGNTVTVSFNQPAAFVDLRITEYSGLSANNAFEAGSSAAGNSVSADSGPVALSTSSDLIFGAGMTGTSYTSSSAGFNLRVITSPDGDIVEDQVAGGPGLYHGLATLESGPWLMQVAAFKPASSEGGPRLSALLSGTNLILSWPTAFSGFTLQANTQLGTATWANATNTVGVVGGQNQVMVPLSGPQTYFRLRSP